MKKTYKEILKIAICLKEDFEQLQRDEWEPDYDSCQCSIDGAFEVIDFLENELAKTKSNKIDEARKFLEEAGYFTGNLWQVDDVQGKFECTDAEAMDVLYKTFSNDATYQQIWESMDAAGDDLKLKRVEDDQPY